MLEKLKIPLHTQAWTTLEAVGGAEVVGEFNLCAKAKVVDTNMLTNIRKDQTSLLVVLI